jgi:2-haloacid dehalogenase
MKTMSRPRFAIIFDFGRVLVDWDPRYLYRKLIPNNPQAIEDFLQEVHFMDWVRLQDTGQPIADTVNEWCQRYPRYCDLISAYDDRYEETIIGPIAGTVDILKALKQAGFPLYGLSNWPAGKFQLVRHKYDFFNWFDDIVISGEVGMAKPDARIYRLVLDRAGKPASQCIFIDDSAGNIQAARQLGFQTILFTSPRQLQQELDKIVGTEVFIQ